MMPPKYAGNIYTMYTDSIVAHLSNLLYSSVSVYTNCIHFSVLISVFAFGLPNPDCQVISPEYLLQFEIENPAP